MNENLSPRLRSVVSHSVALLGEVIKRELGDAAYLQIESIRKQMVGLRDESVDQAYTKLRKTYLEIEKLKASERRGLAVAYTLMLELMNVCENAYRSHRLGLRPSVTEPFAGEKPNAIIYVLTAHPTEARAPHNIAVFHEIQSALVRILNRYPGDEAISFTPHDSREIQHWIEIAWRTPIVRDRAPKVKDEAEHIYSTAIRDDVLLQLLQGEEDGVPFYIRSWVGGDKDGHPGVDEKTLLESLTLSRGRLSAIIAGQIRKVDETLNLMIAGPGLKRVREKLRIAERELRAVRTVGTADAAKIARLRKALRTFRENYEKEFGLCHPALLVVRQVFRTFPALVVPLEIRESSDVLKSKPEGRRPLAIDRMLNTIATISKGCDPRWYVRGFIISMTRSLEDILAAAKKSKAAFGSLKLPIVPLFEEAATLAASPQIVSEMIANRDIARAAKEQWDGLLEIMVGYSDSSKDAGVLASRLAIAKTLPALEEICLKAKLEPVFFHGSGGSIDRGGGSIEDQIAWWPRSAIRRYKVTVQGEMVERSFATPEIAAGQVRHITESAVHGLSQPARFTNIPALENFARLITESYRSAVHNPEFLELIEKVTPYSYLTELKIGSRPAKRATQVSVSGLRAIPWILCWTQTRVLFPTWWGVGTAWEKASGGDRNEIRRAFKDEPVFTSYMKALGFTLAKIELPVWRLYIDQSSLTDERKKAAFDQFNTEYRKALRFFKEVTGHEDLLWFRPWLRESIRLRSAMIHPLNCLQILSRSGKDNHLLRVTVTGISSGMMTTG